MNTKIVLLLSYICTLTFVGQTQTMNPQQGPGPIWSLNNIKAVINACSHDEALDATRLMFSQTPALQNLRWYINDHIEEQRTWLEKERNKNLTQDNSDNE
ncbi:MAG: hypothetical protein WCE21_00515 [Candidatus Babeliales bacterium]